MILKWHNLSLYSVPICALIQAPLKPLLKVGDTPMIPLAKGFSARRTESFHLSSANHPERSSVSIAEISRNLRCPILPMESYMDTSFFRSFCGVLHRLFWMFWPGVCHEMSSWRSWIQEHLWCRTDLGFMRSKADRVWFFPKKSWGMRYASWA